RVRRQVVVGGADEQRVGVEVAGGARNAAGARAAAGLPEVVVVGVDGARAAVGVVAAIAHHDAVADADRRVGAVDSVAGVVGDGVVVERRGRGAVGVDAVG